MKNKSVAKPTAEFPYKKSGQKVGKMRADLKDFQAKQGVQKVDRNGTENLRQLFVKVAPIKVHQEFTKTSPDFRVLSLEILRQRFGAVSVVLEKISQEKCRQCDGKMSAVFNLSFVLLPHIAEYMRKSPIQFDIPSSYLYVVVLKKLCL